MKIDFDLHDNTRTDQTPFIMNWKTRFDAEAWDNSKKAYQKNEAVFTFCTPSLLHCILHKTWRISFFYLEKTDTTEV